jgi:hypothetical protein
MVRLVVDLPVESQCSVISALPYASVAKSMLLHLHFGRKLHLKAQLPIGGAGLGLAMGF